MRKFDHNGLLIAEFQGKLFESSADLNCSSPIFIRRFLHSNLLKKLDDYSIPPFDLNESLKSIVEQFGDTSYGKEKYSKSSLFWMGYMYRYIAYTREQTTDYVMKIFPYKQMNDVFYSFHTQDPEWCVKNLLDLNNISEDVFDKNKKLKKIIKEREYY